MLERLFNLDVPFAMLVGIAGLFESKTRFEMFRDNMFEMLYFNKRIRFLKSYTDEKTALNPPFSSGYVCHNFLEEPMVFEEIDKKEVHLVK